MILNIYKIIIKLYHGSKRNSDKLQSHHLYTSNHFTIILTEWYKDRRKIPDDWGKKLKACQLKTQSLLDKTQCQYIQEYVQENKEGLSL
jgi:hypothetical protein